MLSVNNSETKPAIDPCIRSEFCIAHLRTVVGFCIGVIQTKKKCLYLSTPAIMESLFPHMHTTAHLTWNMGSDLYCYDLPSDPRIIHYTLHAEAFRLLFSTHVAVQIFGGKMLHEN